MNRLKMIIFFITSLSISCKTKNRNCEPSAVRTLYSDVMGHEEHTKAYFNYVSLDSVSIDCISKKYALETVDKYLSNVTNRTRIYCVEFYSMDRGFYIGELSEDLEKMNKNFLFGVYLEAGNIDSIVFRKNRFW